MENKELFELTNPQKSIWYTEQFYEGTTVNNICVSGTLYGNINEDLLKQAINNVVEQNDSFRIHIVLKDNIAKQYISDYTNFNIGVEYINDESEIKQIESEEAKYKFDVIDSDLFRFKIAMSKNNFASIILTVNHLIADSWSLGLVIQEIIKNYNSIKNNENFTPDTFSYLDYINSENEYKNSKKFENDKIYWNQIFNTIPEQATIPCLINGAKNVSYSANRLGFEINKDILYKINDFCRENHISTFNFFMAIFSIYIGRVSNIDDFVIGTPILNRSNFKEKHTTGMFVNTVPVRFDNINDGTFKNLTNNVATKMLGILRHQKYSYNSILEDLREKNGNIPNLYNIIISYQITKAFNSDLGDYKTNWTFNNYCANDFNIHIYDINDTGNLIIDYDYLIDKYSEDDVIDIHNRIVNMINQVLANNDINSCDIEIVTPEEKNKMLNIFNDTYYDYPDNLMVSQLFEKQVEKTPENIALVFGNNHLTYKQLNERANSLAFMLRNTYKLNRNDLVGIMINRSLEMFIAILAVLKAGGTYIPIDPNFPQERIKYMLENGNAKLLLTSEKLKETVDFNNKFAIDLDKKEIYDLPSKNITNINKPDDLTYIIFTSGSTGLPKGVMLKNRNIVNFIFGMMKEFSFTDRDIIVSITTISFDIFVFESLMPLLNGLRVVIANEQEQTNIDLFNKLCIKSNVNIIQTTPSRIQTFIDSGNYTDFIKNITHLLIGGEPFPSVLLENLRKISSAKIYNMYGPTETAVWSTVQNLTNKNYISIGNPIINTECYVLDKNLNILPYGTSGDLYISGDGVSNRLLK